MLPAAGRSSESRRLMFPASHRQRPVRARRLGLTLVPWAIVASACSLLGDAPAGGNGAAAAGGGRAANSAPTVVVGVAEAAPLVDRVEAVGTALANEQADLNSTVTERLARVNFADGAYVPKGAVIAELVRTEQGAQLRQAQARLTEARQRLQRLLELQSRGFATRAQVEEAQAAVDVAQGQVAAARSQLGDRIIRAPFSGWLSLRRISPGTVVTAGTTIATIVDLSRIKLDFPVPETFLPALAPGTPIQARAAAYPGELFTGTVASIDPLVDPVTRAATVRAILPNPDRRLKPGMLLTVEIALRPRTAVVVPELALVGLGERRYVFRLGPDDRVQRVEVRTGLRRDGMVEITQGLSPGDRVVVEGTVKVRDGMNVRPITRAVRMAAAPEPLP